MGVLLALIALGIALILAGKASRHRHGLTDARTLDLDGRTLFSPRLKLAGRPDRVVGEGGYQIPEEWKGSPRVYDSHRVQVSAYFILIEEETGIRPPHGYVVLSNGRRTQIENTPELRARVPAIAEQIRAMRRNPHEPIEVNQPAAKCRACGMQMGCVQRAVP
jgi:CRISPR-associated exonuclease Cas4